MGVPGRSLGDPVEDDNNGPGRERTVGEIDAALAIVRPGNPAPRSSTTALAVAVTARTGRPSAMAQSGVDDRGGNWGARAAGEFVEEAAEGLVLEGAVDG